MGETHVIAGHYSPHRSARRVFAAALLLLCALLSGRTQGDEPEGPRTLPAVAGESLVPYEIAAQTCRRLPPVETTAPAVDAVRFASGHESSFFTDAFGGQQVNFIAPAPGDTNNPLTSLNPGQPFVRFSAMQDDQKAEAESQSAEAEGAAGQGEQQTYGQAPTNNSLQFLRDVDVLLAPGAWQADTGFVYTHFANDFPAPVFNGTGDLVNVQEAEIRRRLLWSPLAFRYGVTNNIQFFSFLPVGFSNTQLSAPTLDFSETQNVSGLGDLNFGCTVHLIDGEDQMPDVIGTVGFTAPTGKFSTPVFGLVPGSNLGQGFWAYNLQLLMINRYDPVIVFYGGGYRHLWENTFDGQVFTPGEQANYMLGVGFAINDRVTLSSTFQGFYITNTFINGQNVRGSNLEPLSMRFAATIVRDCRIIEPFVQIGATDSAPRVNVGVVVTFY